MDKITFSGWSARVNDDGEWLLSDPHCGVPERRTLNGFEDDALDEIRRLSNEMYAAVFGRKNESNRAAVMERELQDSAAEIKRLRGVIGTAIRAIKKDMDNSLPLPMGEYEAYCAMQDSLYQIAKVGE